MRAGIIDYRMGNLASVSKALERVGAATVVSDEAAALDACDLVVLPGVGNFRAGMAHLEELGLTGFVRDWAGAGRPIIGICLGMQLFFTSSEEGDAQGLGVVAGRVKRLPSVVKVPQIGWNAVQPVSSEVLAPFDGRYFYFNHSYVCVPDEPVAAGITDYGGEFVSSIHSGNILGFQFHPEKSSSDGLALLARALGALG